MRTRPDRAHVASMPDTTWPISGHPPGSSRDRIHTPVSMSTVPISTLHRQRRTSSRPLPDTSESAFSHSLTTTGFNSRSSGWFGTAPRREVPEGLPPSSAQHQVTKLYLHQAPFPFGTHIAVGVRMEDRLDFRFQVHLGHRLRDPICDGRHPEHPYAFPASLGDFHGFDRGRKVTPGRHAIPNPVQVLVAVLLELSDRHLIHPSRTLVGFDPLIRLPHNPFRDVKRPVLLLRLAHPTPPGTAG